MHRKMCQGSHRTVQARLAAAMVLAASLFLADSSARAGSVSFTNYNVVSLGNLSTRNDVEGTVFVGGNLSTPGGATQIPSNSSVTYPVTQDTVNVVGDITSGSIVHVEQGSLLYGGSIGGATVNFNGGGTATQDLPTLTGELASLQSQLTNASNAYTALTANSTLTLPTGGQPGPATFNAVANANGLAVFHIDGSFFSNTQIQQVNLNLGAGVKDIVIDVAGSGTINEASLNFVGNWGDTSVRATTIWNFNSAITSINLQNEFPGAILAPDASLVTGNTPVDGSIFAASVTANGEIHIPYFIGFNPLSVPEPSSLMLGGIGLAGMTIFFLYRRGSLLGVGR